MPQLLKPSDVATRLKAGETAQDIFYDDLGARVAKLVGLQANVAAIDGSDDRSVNFTISTDALDRYNSTIAPAGWKIEAFNSNPVVLWGHDDSIPAIARAENTRIEGGKLKSRAVFANRDIHPLADTVYQLVKGKFIGAASVGWIPLKWQFVDEEGRGFGIDYLEQELLEWSVVNIPANPECLVGARSMGIDTKPLLFWAERALEQGGMSTLPRAELEALRKAAGAPSALSVPSFLPARGTRRAQRSDGADWKVGAARDLAVADTDSWDGPAAAKRMLDAAGFDGDKPDSAKARRGFLVYDAAKPDKRESYKEPFADLIGGELKASAAGIRAAASRLPQTDVPQSVRDEARKVLDHYEAKMGDKEDGSLDANAAALETLFANGVLSLEEFTARMMALARAGRVLSEENEAKLQAAHAHVSAANERCMKAAEHVQSANDHCAAANDHCAAAMDHVRSVIEANHKPDPDDDPDDPDDDDPEQAAAAAEKQRQTARVLRLRGGAAAA